MSSCDLTKLSAEAETNAELRYLNVTVSSNRAGSELAGSKSTTAIFRALVRESRFHRFGFTWSCPLRFAEEVATCTQVPLACRSLRTVRAERRSRGLGQSIGSDQAG